MSPMMTCKWLSQTKSCYSMIIEKKQEQKSN